MKDSDSTLSTDINQCGLYILCSYIIFALIVGTEKTNIVQTGFTVIMMIANA